MVSEEVYVLCLSSAAFLLTSESSKRFMSCAESYRWVFLIQRISKQSIFLTILNSASFLDMLRLASRSNCLCEILLPRPLKLTCNCSHEHKSVNLLRNTYRWSCNSLMSDSTFALISQQERKALLKSACQVWRTKVF